MVARANVAKGHTCRVLSVFLNFSSDLSQMSSLTLWHACLGCPMNFGCCIYVAMDIFSPIQIFSLVLVLVYYHLYGTDLQIKI